MQYEAKKGRWDVRLDDHSDGSEVVSLKPSSLTVMRSFASVVRADAAIVASLGRSVAASAAHVASEEAAVGEHGVCPHTHLEEWHGAPEPFHWRNAAHSALLRFFFRSRSVKTGIPGKSGRAVSVTSAMAPSSLMKRLRIVTVPDPNMSISPRP